MANSKLMRPTIVGPLMNGRQRQKARTAMDAINSEVLCRTRIERGARMCHVRASHYKCSRSITTRSHNGANDEGPWEVQGHDKRVCDRSRSPAQPLNDARPDGGMTPPDRVRHSSIHGASRPCSTFVYPMRSSFFHWAARGKPRAKRGHRCQ